MWKASFFLPTGKVWHKEFDTLIQLLCFRDTMLSAGIAVTPDLILIPSLWRSL